MSVTLDIEGRSVCFFQSLNGDWYEQDRATRTRYLCKDDLAAALKEIERLRVWSSDSHVTELDAEVKQLQKKLDLSSRKESYEYDKEVTL